MPYIASTLASNNDYVDYHPVSSGANPLHRKVTIKGGAGVASMQHALANGVLTPQGVVTAVTDDELDFLMNNAVFKMHLDGGFLQVLKSEAKADKAAENMNKKDASRPLTDDDTKEGGRIAGGNTKMGKIK